MISKRDDARRHVVMLLLVTFVQLASVVLGAQDICSVHSEEVLTPWIQDSYGRLQFPIYNADPIAALENNAATFEGTEPCHLNNSNVICQGNLQTNLFNDINTPLNNLVVLNYNVDKNGTTETSSKITTCGLIDEYQGNDEHHRDTRFKLTTATYKATGDVFSKAVGMGMRLSASLEPNDSYDEMVITGDAFSNQLRVGWQVSGNLKIANNNKFVIIEVYLSTVNTVGTGGWRFSATCVLEESADDGWTWAVNGTVEVSLIPISFKGVFITTQEQKNSSFTINGKVTVTPLHIDWEVNAAVTLSSNTAITICREFLKGKQLKHLYFKDSYFLGDIDKDALQGIQGLETISFSNSKLEEVPRLDLLFYGLKNLRAIYFESSSMPNIDMGDTPTLSNLEFLSFKGSGPLQFTRTSTNWLQGSNLTYLNLQDCNINVATDTTNGVLEPVSATLLYLDLSYTSIREEVALARMLKGLQLTHLSLAGLQLTKVPTSALYQVNRTIRYLTLRENNFRKVPDENMFSVILDFPPMGTLEELDLTHCGINYIEAGVFDTLPGLKRLFLAHNNVENVQDGWYLVSPTLMHIDLSWNGESVGQAEFSLQPGGGLVQLTAVEIVDLSNAVFTYPETMVLSLSNTTRILSLCNNDLQTKSRVHELHLPNLTILDISGNSNIEFGTPQIAQFLLSLVRLKSLYARNNRITNSFFTSIHDLAVSNNISVFIETLEILDMSGNSIKFLLDNFFGLFPNIREIDLSSNSIAVWTAPLYLTPKLRSLKLSDNKMESISGSFLQGLVDINTTELGKNPFVCHCDMQKFSNAVTDNGTICGHSSSATYHRKLPGSFAMIKTKVGSTQIFKAAIRKTSCVTLTDWMNGSNYYCYHQESEKMTWISEVKNDTDLCKDVESSSLSPDSADHFEALYIGVAVVLTLALAGGFIYWKWWEIRLMTRAVRNAAILTLMDNDESDEPKDMQYHAFVSYCEKDRHWVLQHMIPQLEQWNEVSVCLHERDFEVGVSILENITSSMDKSRHLVIVLSQSFVRSQWCQFELQLAQHRIIEKKRDKLVLVLLEPIPAYKKPKTLRYLMRTNTYIEWPADGNNVEVQRFWNRLIKAIE